MASTNNSLDEEARAFDQQIKERIAHGHIPDLRRVENCDYFYNNSWRRPEFVHLDQYKIFEQIKREIDQHCAVFSSPRILEVGCGPGYMSLELSRCGYDVTGIDVSKQSIEIALNFAQADPWIQERGNLNYVAGDIMTCPELTGEKFDAVVFLGSLHHFADQDKIGKRTLELLSEQGLVIAHEPTRDRISDGLLEFIILVRILLSVGGGFYKSQAIPTSEIEIETALSQLRNELLMESESGQNTQSPHDNEAGHQDMIQMLSSKFETLRNDDTYAFFHETIGGLRYSEETNANLAKFLREIDSRLVKSGVLPGSEFIFVGKKRP